jgi:sugar (pentulose or hexulose) kinase
MMSVAELSHTLIIDIGKTHVKLLVLNSCYEAVHSTQMSNTPVLSDIYPCADVSAIWKWLCSSITTITPKYSITKLTITTHGATAALIDKHNASPDGLVLPILDYECTKPFDDSISYETDRPDFVDTFSPSLPGGLNLGRQLYWLKESFPEAFANTTDILMYPQYWAWRFTGESVSEITSLGCHTDLWSIKDNTYSELVKQLDCIDLFPKLKPAWHKVGDIKDDLCHQLGLPKGCEFFSGLHDSNASFLRYRIAQENKPFTVISTGTWTILMASQVSLSNLKSDKDMLANIDAFGSPIACARFMGGREFEAICEQAGSWLGEQFNQNDIQNVINNEVFALPDFSDGSGPFGGAQSKLIGPVNEVSGIAIATLYCALMIDYQLDMLGAHGDVYIEGAFLKNPLLCSIVNSLRLNQEVMLSEDSTGTVLGAAYLTQWDTEKPILTVSPATVIQLEGLDEFKQKWRELTKSNEAVD